MEFFYVSFQKKIIFRFNNFVLEENKNIFMEMLLFHQTATEQSGYTLCHYYAATETERLFSLVSYNLPKAKVWS